jgi:hypothetical protein
VQGQSGFTEINNFKSLILKNHPEWKKPFELLFGYSPEVGSNKNSLDKVKKDEEGNVIGIEKGNYRIGSGGFKSNKKTGKLGGRFSDIHKGEKNPKGKLAKPASLNDYPKQGSLDLTDPDTGEPIDENFKKWAKWATQ